MNIEFTEQPNSTDLDFLTQKINQEIKGFGSAYPFAFFVRDETDKVIAGCNGSVIFGCIYTDQLWVDIKYRNKGLGTKLMGAVHDYGRQSGCTMATVATMSFQDAEAFYKKIGYAIDFERKGYTKGSRCLFLRKAL
jgi:GNAT superfamily N-acetyltransferase